MQKYEPSKQFKNNSCSKCFSFFFLILFTGYKMIINGNRQLVTIQKLTKLLKHPNADKCLILQLLAYGK